MPEQEGRGGGQEGRKAALVVVQPQPGEAEQEHPAVRAWAKEREGFEERPAVVSHRGVLRPQAGIGGGRGREEPGRSVTVHSAAPAMCTRLLWPPPRTQAKDALATIDGRLMGTLLGVRSQPSLPLSVEGHVARLVEEAMDKENLGSMYVWWMPWF